MFRFLIGIALGAFVAYYLERRPKADELESYAREMGERGIRVLDESRRILDETRDELGLLATAGRLSVQQKAERLRRAAAA